MIESINLSKNAYTAGIINMPFHMSNFCEDNSIEEIVKINSIYLLTEYRQERNQTQQKKKTIFIYGILNYEKEFR